MTRPFLFGFFLVLALCGLAGFLYFHNAPINAPSPTTSPNMVLGNPSGATVDAANKDNYLMVKPYFALAYNDSAGIPNWVSWRVTAADLGDAPRKEAFDADETLPPAFYRVMHENYSHSGFDRGHMCPHSDRAANKQMSFATFVMTNIIPQAPNVNRKAWAQLEEYCRNLVRNRQRLYITAGPAGKGGRGSVRFEQSLADGRVRVPAECWKIVVAIAEDGGADDPGKIGPASRVIAVIMPNDNSAVGEEWARFRTSPAEIERRTRLHFFDRLPAAVAEVLRNKVDDEPIAEPRPLSHHHEH